MRVFLLLAVLAVLWAGSGAAPLLTFHAPAVAVTTSGNPIITTTACPQQGLCSFLMIVCDSPKCANTTTHVLSTNIAFPNRVYRREVILNNAGMPVTALCTANQLTMFTCTNANCTTAPGATQPGVACAESMVSLALNQQTGCLIGSMSCSNKIGFVHLCLVTCTTPACTSANVLPLTNDAVAIGENPLSATIVFGGDNLAFASAIVGSWTGGANVDRFHCGDSECSSVQTQAPDVAAFHSAAIVDPAGFPVIAETLYYGGLGLHQCNSYTCASGQSVTFDVNIYYRSVSAVVGPPGSGFGFFVVTDQDNQSYEKPSTLGLYCPHVGGGCGGQNSTTSTIAYSGFEPAVAYSPLYNETIVTYVDWDNKYHLVVMQCSTSFSCVVLNKDLV